MTEIRQITRVILFELLIYLRYNNNNCENNLSPSQSTEKGEIMKRILSLMLAICLTISVVVVSASAAGANDSVFAGANLNLNEGIAIQFLAYPEAVEEYDSSYLSVKYRDRDETLLTKEIGGV